MSDKRSLGPQEAQKLDDTAPDSPDSFGVRFAETDGDVIAIHRFLCFVATPALMAPVDPDESITEINSIVKDTNYGFALMAMQGDVMIGTMGVIAVPWWYNTRVKFFTDRWFFTVEGVRNRGVGAALIAEADAIAKQADIDLIVNGKFRRQNNSRVVRTLPKVRIHRPMVMPQQSSKAH